MELVAVALAGSTQFAADLAELAVEQLVPEQIAVTVVTGLGLPFPAAAAAALVVAAVILKQNPHYEHKGNSSIKREVKMQNIIPF